MPEMLRRTISNLKRTIEIGRRSHYPANEQDSGRFPFPIYLINLDRAVPRRRFAVGQLNLLGIQPTAIHGVDGGKLDLAELVEQGIYDPTESNSAFSRQLSMAEIGCSLSHYEIYQMVLDRGDDAALIIEDDALLLPGFEDNLRAAYLELPENWGILHLNCPCKRFEKAGIRIVKYDGVGSLPTAASAYLISRRGAEILCEQALPIRYPADSLVGRGLRWGVETYGTVNAITSINNVFPTQIQKPNGVRGRIKSWVKLVLARLMYRGG